MNTGSVLAQFTITLTQAVSEPVLVDWYTSDGTAKAGVDYAAGKGTATFAPGETSKTISILVYGRAVGSEDRSFFVEMLPPVNAILGASIGECIIHVDTTGSTPVTVIVVPSGPRGLEGKSAYQVWLDLGNTGTEQDFIDSLSPPIDEIAAEVAPLIDVGNTTLTAQGTESLGRPDATNVKAVARRVAYVGAAKIATVTLADGENTLAVADLAGDTIDFNANGFVPRILRAGSMFEPSWYVNAAGKLVVKAAVAGDVLYATQYDVVSKSQPFAREGDVFEHYERSTYNKLRSFEKGTHRQVTSAADAVLWEGATGGQGPYFRWDGTYPKTVPAGSTPLTTGGIAAGAWVSVGDAILRTDLAKPNGVDLVGGALKQASLVLQAITKIPSYNPADVTQAWKDSVASFGYVYFPGYSASLSTYNIIGDDPLLHGTTVYVDANVNLAFDYDYYPLIGSLNIHGRCQFSFTSKNFSTKGGKVDAVGRNAKINRFPLKASAIAFSDCIQQSVNSDTYTTGSFGSSSTSAILVPLATGITSGLFTPIAVGEAISAHIRVETGSVTGIGILLRCANGWIKLFRAPNSPGSWTYQVKQVGQAVVTGNPIPAPSNSLNSYSAGKASIGISLISRSSFRLLINGVAGYFPLESWVGDIYDIGFICEGAAASSVARVTGLCSYKTDDLRAHGAAPMNIAIYGDSTAERWLSTFDRYLPQVMDGEGSSRTVNISNFAVAGETFAQQLARLKANGPGDASIICMVAGTNEAQGGITADSFAAQVLDFLTWCGANSRTPMLVEPWMWYAKSFIGGSGQNSSNYDNASELREAGKRVAVSYGAIYVSTTHELPAPLPEYFGTSIDPLLRDDIHQSELAYRLYAELIGSHIVEFMTRVNRAGRAVPMQWANTTYVTAIAANSRVTENSLSASVTVTGFANGGTVLRLPRGCRPDRTTQFTGAFLLPGGSYAPCKLEYLNGQLTADGLTQSATTIIINITW